MQYKADNHAWSTRGSPKVGWPWCNPYMRNYELKYMASLYTWLAIKALCSAAMWSPGRLVDFGRTESHQQVSEGLKSQGKCTAPPGRRSQRSHCSQNLQVCCFKPLSKQGAQRYKSQANSWVKLSAHTHARSTGCLEIHCSQWWEKRLGPRQFFPTIDSLVHIDCAVKCTSVCVQCGREASEWHRTTWEINSVHVR